MGTININTSTWKLSITSNTSWGVIVSSKTDLGLGMSGTPDYPYWARDIRGSGNLESDVSMLPIGEYIAVLHEINIGITDQVVFTKTKNPGITHKACVSGYCQSVSGIGIDQCTTLGELCTGDYKRKELVTNLTSNENFINAAIIISGSPCADLMYIGKRQEGSNWIFTYSLRTTCTYTEMGAGAGLTKFIAANWASISKLLVMLGVVAIVWLWRDAQTAQPEAEATISTNDTLAILEILKNLNLTSEQKESLIAQILQKSYSSTDWQTTALYVVGILAGAYIIGTFLNRSKVK